MGGQRGGGGGRSLMRADGSAHYPLWQQVTGQRCSASMSNTLCNDSTFFLFMAIGPCKQTVHPCINCNLSGRMAISLLAPFNHVCRSIANAAAGPVYERMIES